MALHQAHNADPPLQYADPLMNIDAQRYAEQGFLVIPGFKRAEDIGLNPLSFALDRTEFDAAADKLISRIGEAQ